jgi:integrase
VRLLLRATSAWQNSAWQMVATCRMDSATFRTLLVTLYATGMRLGEALSLMREDVDLKRGVIAIRGGRVGRPRRILIGRDLCSRLRRHKCSLARVPAESLLFFVGKDGKAIN